MLTIQLRIEGNQAESMALSLQQYVKSEWGIHSPVTSAGKAAPVQSKDLLTTLAIVGCILQIPGFINSSAELAERIQAKQKLEKLIAWIEKQGTMDGAIFWIDVGGIPYPLRAEQLPDILDALERQSR